MDDPIFLLCNESLAVLNKPGGLLTQAPPGIDSLELRVRAWRSQQIGIAAPYIGIPHRLDRPASGAILVGWSRGATRKLAQQFERRQIEKYYWCVVTGEVSPTAGEWVDWMRKIPDEARSERVNEHHPSAQLAVLRYRVLGRAAGLTWLGIHLETGRTHQIRLQCAARGFPILGDELYGCDRPFGPRTLDQRARWIALHARQLVVPIGGQQDRPMSIEAPLFDHWLSLKKNFPQMGEG